MSAAGRIRRWHLALAGVLVVVVSALALVTTGGDDEGASVATGRTTSTRSRGVDATASTSPSSIAAVETTAPPSDSASTAPPPRPPAAAPATTAPAPGPTPADCPPPAPGSDFAGFGAAEIAIDNAEGRHRSCVLTADTPEQQRRGLMAQDDLDGYDGMIFRFPDERERSFWMRDTRIPLSIAFFDARGTFVSAADMEPCGDRPDCPTYSSGGPARYALEVLRGRLPAAGATPGARLAAV